MKHALARILRNMAGYGYAQIVTLVVQLALIPVFLGNWGTTLYAEWVVITGIPLLLSLMEPGVAQASATRATMMNSRGDVARAKTSIHTALAFTLLVVCAISSISIAVALSVDWTKLLNLHKISRSDCALVLVLTSMYLCIQLLGGPVEAWARAVSLTARGAFLLANRRVLDILVTVAMLPAGAGPVELASLMVLAQVVGLFIIVLSLRRVAPINLLGLREASMAELKIVSVPAVAYLGFPIAQLVTLQSGIQILNQVADARAVVGFVMARTLMRLIIQIGVVTSQASRPELSRLIGVGDLRQAVRLADRIWLSALAASALAYALLAAIGPEVLKAWSSNAVIVSRGTLALIGLHAFIYVAWIIPVTVQMAGNKHAVAAGAYCVGSVVGVLVWIGLFRVVTPVTGAAIAMLVPEIIVLCLVLLTRCRSQSASLQAGSGVHESSGRN